MQKYVIIFNGPANSGKDAAVRGVLEEVEVDGWTHQMFKTPLYEITAAIYRIPLDTFVHWATDRTLKETPNDALGGHTPRQVLIEVSEKVIKPYYGSDYFGRAAVSELRQSEPHPNGNYFLFSDGGFVEEAVPLFDYVGRQNSLVIRLHRDGCTYNGDSRRYLEPEEFGYEVEFVDVKNDASEKDLVNNVLVTIQEFVERPRAKSKKEGEN